MDCPSSGDPLEQYSKGRWVCNHCQQCYEEDGYDLVKHYTPNGFYAQEHVSRVVILKRVAPFWEEKKEKK